MKSQSDKLKSFSEEELLWATMKLDEVLQDVFQNFLLFRCGLTPMLFLNSADKQMLEFIKLKKQLFLSGEVNEVELRATVINLLQQLK